MYAGKLVFAQLMGHLPLHTFRQCVAKYPSDIQHSSFRTSINFSVWPLHNELIARVCATSKPVCALSQIKVARKLYAQDGFAVELEQTAYALNTTTIDLCLNVFPWAYFRKAKAAVKLHTLLYLRGNIPSFIHISDGKMHEVNVLDLMIPEAGKDYPQHLRRIRFHDTEHDKEPVFLTNNFDLPALTVAQLYRYRWQIELFFNGLSSIFVSRRSTAPPRMR